jgi:hypothetical protein
MWIVRGENGDGRIPLQNVPIKKESFLSFNYSAGRSDAEADLKIKR